MTANNGHSQPTLNEVFRSIPETDRQRISELIFNARTMRQEWLQKFADPRRDIDMECGYPVTTAMNAKLYKKMFDRNQTAARVVEVMPIECWQASVEVYEDEKSDVKTPFEVAFDQVADSLRGTSWYKDEKASPLWEALQRADILSGIGHFGVILLGLDDGKELSEPVDGINDRGEASVSEEEEPLDVDEDGLDEEDDADPESNGSYLPKRKTEKDVKPTGNLFKPGGKKAGEDDPAAAEDAAGSDDGDDADVVDEDRDVVDPEKADLEEKPVETKRKLLYVRVFDESLVEIQVYESDKTNPRFGQPKMYSITLNDPDDAHSGLGLSMATIEVHWTRIIHIADNRNSSEVLGVPRQRPVLNRLLDLDKLYGGSAEMYWRGAFPGLSIETHPQLGGDVRMDADGVRSAIERYANSLQRFIAVEGVSVKTLSPQVVDPSTQIDTQITAICIKIACPKRIFMGSERGELASGQDSDTWDARVEGRRTTYITPRIIVPLVDRLIAVGVLPVPKEYHVAWHSKKQLSPMDQAQVAQQRIMALAAYIAGGCDVILSPMDLLTRELGYDDEEAEAILEATLKHMAEANPDAEEDLVPGKDPTPEPVEVMLDGDGKPHELKPGQKAVVAGGGPGGPPMPPGKGQPPGGPGKPPGGKPKFPPKNPTGNVLANYDPDQARADDGKWTDGGGGSPYSDGAAFARTHGEVSLSIDRLANSKGKSIDEFAAQHGFASAREMTHTATAAKLAGHKSLGEAAAKHGVKGGSELAKKLGTDVASQRRRLARESGGKPTGNRRGPSRSFSWNEDGDNCGTGAGGFQEGNTCAKGGGSGSGEAKPVSARVGRIAKEVMAAAEKVEITSDVVGDPPPPSRSSRRDAVDVASQTGHDYGPDHDFTDDIDTIEEMMTSRERERMEDHLSDMAYESASELWNDMDHSDEELGIEDQIENIEVDYASVARDNGYSSDDVETSAHDVIFGETEEGEVRDNLSGAVTAALMTARADGVDAFGAAIEALEEADAPAAIISELKDRRSTAEEEIQTAADEVRDREAEQIRSDAIDNARDSFIDSYTSDYDSSDDREYYLKDFYERHSTEPRFRPREEVEAERAAAAAQAALERAQDGSADASLEAKPQSSAEAAKTSKLNKWGTERGYDSSMQYRFETPTNKYSIDMGISRGGGLPGLYHDPQAKIGNLTFGGEIGGFGKAKTGNSNLVFGTVAPAVTALAMKRDLDVITFSASHVDVSDEQKAAAIKAGRDPEKLGKSRQRLYDMLSQTIATANPKYAVLAKGRGDYRSYYVVKREILEKTKNSVRAAAGKSWDEYVKDSDIDILVNQAGYELVRNWINPRWFTKAFWDQNADIITNVFCATGEGGGVDPTCSPEGSTVAVRDGRGVAVEPVTPPPPGEVYNPRVTVDANGDGVTDHARVGVPAMVVPPPPSLDSYRLPNLTADERRVEDQVIALFESDPQKMVRDMIDMVRSAGDGKTFSTDDAKQLFLGVWNNAVPEIQMQLRHLYNTPLHQAANAIAKQALIEHLDTLKPGDNVLVTVGGCGAGKGYSLKNTDLKANAQAVWDSAGDQNATENPWILKLARERGLTVTYAYVHADPKVAWAHPEFGVVKRASNPKDGRMVDAAVFADSYAIGAKNHAAFARRHAGDKDVKFLYFQAGKPLDKMPREAFVNRNGLYKFALETIDGVEDATIKRGATIGKRIWKGK